MNRAEAAKPSSTGACAVPRQPPTCVAITESAVPTAPSLPRRSPTAASCPVAAWDLRLRPRSTPARVKRWPRASPAQTRWAGSGPQHLLACIGLAARLGLQPHVAHQLHRRTWCHHLCSMTAGMHAAANWTPMQCFSCCRHGFHCCVLLPLQSVTRAVRDGVHRLSEGVSAAGAAAGNAAGAAVDKTKEALQVWRRKGGSNMEIFSRSVVSLCFYAWVGWCFGTICGRIQKPPVCPLWAAAGGNCSNACARTAPPGFHTDQL